MQYQCKLAEDRTRTKSQIAKRSIVIAGQNTSISLENEFWEALKAIAAARRASPSDLVTAIDAERQNGNLSSAIRLFILEYYMSPVPNNS